MKTDISRIKPIVYLVILFVITFCNLSASADTMPQVKTDKNIYKTGETIRVSFTNASGRQQDWMCIVAAGAPDNDAGDYRYMPGRLTEGELNFEAPAPGKYEVRAFYNYSRNGYVVSARYSFSVVDVQSAPLPAAGVEKIKPVESSALKDLAASAERFNVSVFYFTPLGVDAVNYGIIVTNTLTNAPKMQSSFAMLDRKDLEVFLASNNLQQNDQLDSIIEIGSKLGLNFVIAGSVGKRGTTIVTNCKVISIGQRNVIFTSQFMSKGESDLISNVSKMSNSIIEAILRRN